MAASDESTTVVSSMVEDDYDDIDVVGFDDHDHDHHQVHPHNLSRLSMCTSSMNTNEDDCDDDDDGDDHHLETYISRLSIESFDADVDEEELRGKELQLLHSLSSDSDDKEPGCYSLPATPPRRRNRKGVLSQARQLMGVVKDYASENEAEKGSSKPYSKKKKINLRKRRIMYRDRWADDSNNNNKKEGGLIGGNYSNNSGSFSGESEGGGVVVITRPKGGQRSLCMDMEEVKACRDLGFELEHEHTIEMTNSGGNSPIGNWRISSPGDDPRDVKARLKMWAQAVALASTSRHCS